MVERVFLSQANSTKEVRVVWDQIHQIRMEVWDLEQLRRDQPARTHRVFWARALYITNQIMPVLLHTLSVWFSNITISWTLEALVMLLNSVLNSKNLGQLLLKIESVLNPPSTWMLKAKTRPKAIIKQPLWNNRNKNTLVQTTTWDSKATITRKYWVPPPVTRA